MQNGNKGYKDTKSNENDAKFDCYNIKYDWDNIFKHRNYCATVRGLTIINVLTITNGILSRFKNNTNCS